MPPRCKSCSHPQRAEIDAAIIDGVSLRNIARRFDGPSPWSIHRHTKHAQSTLLAGITAQDAALAERLRTKLEEVLERELNVSQEHLHTLVSAVYRKPTAEEWKAAVDGLWGGYVRVIAYLQRLLREGSGTQGPNSRAELIQGISEFTGMARLRRAKPTIGSVLPY